LKPNELIEHARYLEARGDRVGAAAALRRAAEAPSHTGRALAHLGRVQRKRGRPHDALSTYKAALHHLEAPRELARVYAEIGQLYYAMHEDGEAAYYFRRAAGLDPTQAHHLGSVSRSIGAGVHQLDTADIDIIRLQ